MFEVRVNGEPVTKSEAQVIGVSLRSARGELYKAGISNEGVIDLVLETVNAGDPMRLDQLEAAQRRFNASLVEGQVTGTPPQESDRTFAKNQGIQDDTLRPGGPSSEIAQQGTTAPPQHDLTSGLDPSDPDYSDKVTDRINQFGESGDSGEVLRDAGQQPALTEQTEGNAPVAETQPVESVDAEPEAQPVESQPAEPQAQSPGTPTNTETAPTTSAPTTPPNPDNPDEPKPISFGV